MPDALKPNLVAMILCDAVYAEPATGKLTLLGTIDSVHHTEFPASYPCLMVFVELTNGRGDASLLLKVRYLPSDNPDAKEIATFEPLYKVDFTDPRLVLKTVFDASSVCFREPGEYRFTVEWGGEFVAERRLTAIRRET